MKVKIDGALERAPFEPGQYRVRKDRTGAGWIWDRVREQKGGGDA